MHRTILPLLVVASTAVLPGCLSVKYSAQRSIDAGASRGDVHRTWQHSLFLGLIPVSAVPLDSYCPDTGVLHVRSQVGPLGMLATVATLGVWTPTRVKVTCADWPAVAMGPFASPEAAWDAVTPPGPWVDPAPAPLGLPVEPPPAPPAAQDDGGGDTIIFEDEHGRRVIIVR
ncbi:MAG: hypothetical protein H6733_01870 [Alphaproteobacteria bacterium]|nr:hypothetical protein [Alphaproteobacteria bacterium]